MITGHSHQVNNQKTHFNTIPFFQLDIVDYDDKLILNPGSLTGASSLDNQVEGIENFIFFSNKVVFDKVSRSLRLYY